jgi:hypothetical protein
VVLADADEPAAFVVDHCIRVSIAGFAGESMGRTTKALLIESLVLEVGEVDPAAPNGEGASSVLVHSGAHTEFGRRAFCNPAA